MNRIVTTALHRPRRSIVRLLEQLGLVRRSFGLNGLDHKLLAHVNHRYGVFVEAGANDGLSQSNTAYFERYLGWRGLLVEPIPELAAQCRLNRPNSIVEECALVAGGDAPNSVEMMYCNLMSMVSGARGSVEADRAHIDAGRQYLAPEDEVRQVVVPTRALSDLLDHYGFSHVDLLSLDVEGYEEQALRGLDFNRHAPIWILVEANDPAAVEVTLREQYQLIDTLSHHDRLYRLK